MTSAESLAAAAAPLPTDFERVYAEHFAFVYRNARRLGVSEGNVDDVVQEVFLVLFRRLHEYDARASLKSWVYGILANTVRGQRRTFRRKQAKLVSADDDAPLSRVPASGNPERTAQKQQDTAFLLGLLGELDEAQRELIVLSDLEQLSVPEICACIGGNPNTVATRLRVARQALRGKLERALLTRRRQEKV
jgi:RNA polymerase sigma-70 factor (ECF subfamily)